MENHFNCIYCYTNKVNGKKYVGQAKDFLKRHREHINSSYNKNQNYDYNVPFHNAIRKYGKNNFTVEILKEDLENQDELNYWECFYIIEFDTLAKNGKGYNLASGGHNGNVFEGKSEEEKAEISRKISETWHNKTDEEMKEFRKKCSENMKKRYENMTEEERAEIGKKHSEIMNNKTDEEKAERNRKISETINNKSEEEKAERIRKFKEAWHNKTDEEKKEYSKKRSKAYYNKSDEEKAEISRKLSEAYYNKTDEEKAERNRKWHETMNNKTDEEKAERNRKWHETMNNKSEEEKAERNRKMSERMTGKKNPSAKKIAQKDLDGNIIKIWDYAKQISEELGFNYGTLGNYLWGKYKGKRKPYKGYIWECVD